MSEIPGSKSSLQEWNFQYRDTLDRKDQIKEGIVSGGSIKDSETKNNNNALFISTGEYPPYIPSVTNTVLVGQGDVIFKATGSPGTSTSAHISYDTKVSNARFLGTIAVDDSSTAIFHNCVFDGEITVAAGCNMHIIGCLFQDKGRINNAGTVFIMGSSRKSGLAHIGIAPVIFGETT